MKVLEITMIPPDKKSGGGLGIYQSIVSIANNAEVDYIGPEYDEEIFRDVGVRIEKKYILKSRRNAIKSCIRTLFLGITTSFYDDWLLAEKVISWNEYDYIHIESSRYNFLLKASKKHGKRCIVRMHNIENDYELNIWKLDKTIFNFVKYLNYSRNEKNALKQADLLVFLTKNDQSRAMELYGNICSNQSIIPVCIEEKRIFTTELYQDTINVLITGTLSYGPNFDGVMWFLNNVWNNLNVNSKIRLIIAGANPCKELIETTNLHENVVLVASPEDMEPYFCCADVFLAPIFVGAGMKVKVAEALAHGLPVIGTEHAWIGYDEIQEGKIVVKNANEAIEQLEMMCSNKLDGNRRASIRTHFNERLSIDSSISYYKKLLVKETGR